MALLVCKSKLDICIILFVIFSLIDVSEVRLKVSLETAPAQRPHGILGVWSPILSAVGNAFKIQVIDFSVKLLPFMKWNSDYDLSLR